MAKLSEFTNRASTEAQSVAKCDRDSCTEPGSSLSRPAPSPLGPTHRTPADDPPARKAERADSPDDAKVTPISPLPLAESQLALLWTGQPCMPQRHLLGSRPGHPLC